MCFVICFEKSRQRYIEKTNGALNLAPFVMFFILNDVKRLLFEFAAFAIMPSMAVK